MTRRASAAARLQATIRDDRDRIAAGQRPRYHVQWARSPFDDSADVRIAELPIIHLFVPDRDGVFDGARVLIARTLNVELDAFDVVLAEEPAVRPDLTAPPGSDRAGT